MAVVLVACGVKLRSEFDEIAPGRDHASDGWLGDKAHEQEVSDHNNDEAGRVPIRDADRTPEVHAIDVDNDLRESDLTMEKVVQFLLGRCRSGAENRLRYIIYNRRIWEASNGWKQRAYTGPSAHTEHAHFSFSYDTAREASKASWHLGDIPVALTAADKGWLASEIDKAATAAAARVWATKITDYTDEGKPQRQLTAGVWQGWSDGRHEQTRRDVIAAVNAAADRVLAAVGIVKK